MRKQIKNNNKELLEKVKLLRKIVFNPNVFQKVDGLDYRDINGIFGYITDTLESHIDIGFPEEDGG